MSMSFNSMKYHPNGQSSSGGDEAIHRGNYLNWFLLYVDNELSALQQKAVEQFIAKHADLRAELDLLLATRMQSNLQTDEAFRQSLLRSEVDEETLLLYIDNELPPEQRRQLELQLATDEKLRSEVKWLQSTVATPDENVVFPDKSLLFKHTTVVSLRSRYSPYLRYAAAAAVLLLMMSVGLWLLLDKQATPDALLLTIDRPVQKPSPQQPTSSTDKVHAYKATSDRKTTDVVALAQNTHLEEPVVKPSGKHAKQTSAAAVQRSTADDKIQMPTITEPIVAANLQPADGTTENNYPAIGNISDASSVKQETKTSNTYAVYASYDFNEEADEEDAFSREEDRMRRSGLKGLVRRIKRTVERTTPFKTGSYNQVSFGVFAVNNH